jgi:hypothetical protein
MLWLLESAPGLPTDAPLSIGDLGAGTCAACLGARYALRDYSNGEHPFKVWPSAQPLRPPRMLRRSALCKHVCSHPDLSEHTCTCTCCVCVCDVSMCHFLTTVDVASSSARFEEAFRAMTESSGVPRWGGPAAGGFTREALLPDQAPSQYLTEARCGVDHLATSMLAQLTARGERQPHLIMASFSLHYLKRDARAAFFLHLKTVVTRPLLLLIVKGVDSVARHRSEPMISDKSVPSVFMGIHYFLGRDPKPRVVEAHLALIQPAGAEREIPYDLCAGYNRDDPDSWVLCTFAAVEQRCSRHGLYHGTTELPEEKLAAATWT